MENRPCFGIDCGGSSQNNQDFYDNQIFPTEVDNIKEFMDNSYSTNLNGYSNGYNSLDDIEREANGKINIHKINYNGSISNQIAMNNACKNGNIIIIFNSYQGIKILILIT